MAGTLTSLTGPIGFVGLIVPHAVRMIWGPDYRQLLPMSMVLGATFLILADLAAKKDNGSAMNKATLNSDFKNFFIVFTPKFFYILIMSVMFPQ